MHKKIILFLFTLISISAMAQQKIVQTAGRTRLGEFAPEFAHLNDDVLFGEVWSRYNLLSLRDRSLVTITSLISQGITDNSLNYHLSEAKKNGITRTEIAEIITHIAFYAGWPKAWAAFNQAKEIWADDETQGDSISELAFPKGSANTAYARYFVGNSYLAPLAPKNLGEGQQLAYPPRGASNTHLRCGERVVSRMGETCYCTTDGRYYRHSGRRETLARSTERCVVSTYCHTYKRRRHHLQRVVGSSVR